MPYANTKQKLRSKICTIDPLQSAIDQAKLCKQPNVLQRLIDFPREMAPQIDQIDLSVAECQLKLVIPYVINVQNFKHMLR